MDHSTLHPPGRGRGERRWSVGVVLLVALGLMLAVPLASRAIGAGSNGKPANFPGCGIAPWTGTCTCMLTPSGSAMTYADFATAVRDPNVRPRVRNPDQTLADARRVCNIPDTPAQNRAAAR